MINVLIIGNGFDLAHGFKTTYSDFLTFCDNLSQDDLAQNDVLQQALYKNMWLSHFLMRRSDMGSTWIDFEEEILNVVKDLSNVCVKNKYAFPRIHYFQMVSNCKNTFSFQSKRTEVQTSSVGEPGYICMLLKYSYRPLKKDYKQWKVFFDELQNGDSSYCCFSGDANWSTVIFKNAGGVAKYVYDELRRFVKALEYYLVTVNNAAPQISYAMRKGVQFNTVLNFNYTNTLERLYPNALRNTVYIHGRVNNGSSFEECNLVLGTRSFSVAETISENFDIFAKYHQRQNYGTIKSYQALLSQNDFQNFTDNWIGIIGHSLNTSDELILKRILTENKGSQITVYFHNADAKNNLISRIYALLGEEDAERRVSFVQQHDLTQGLLIPVASNDL